jgi:hypothetical protein
MELSWRAPFCGYDDTEPNSDRGEQHEGLLEGVPESETLKDPSIRGPSKGCFLLDMLSLGKCSRSSPSYQVLCWRGRRSETHDPLPPPRPTFSHSPWNCPLQAYYWMARPPGYPSVQISMEWTTPKRSPFLPRRTIPINSGLIFPVAGSVLVSGREQPLL